VSVELVAGLISGVTVVFLVLLLIIFFLCFRDRYRDLRYLFLRRLPCPPPDHLLPLLQRQV
jgi:hypothetical protein